MGVTWRRRSHAVLGLSTLALLSGCAVPADRLEDYLGRWDMTLQTPERDYPSWLEVVEKGGRPQVRLVSRWGHARWLDEAEIVDGKLRFVSPAEEEGLEQDLVFEAALRNGNLVGTAGEWRFDAMPAPALVAWGEPGWGAPIGLFDGKSLAGWHPRDPGAAPWQVWDGLLVTPERGGNDLVSDASFTDFRLHAEFRVAKGANSGIYLRGRYEVQIENDPVPEGPTMRTGAVYGYLEPHPPAERGPGVWHSYDITLIGRTVTVALDGRTVIEKAEIPGLTGGALTNQEGDPGPIMLQGSENGQVEFRRIIIMPAISSPSST